MAYAQGDRVLIKVEQEGGETTYVPGTVSTVSSETPYGVTIDGDEVESTWYVDSELAPAPTDEPADPPAEPDNETVAAARRGTRPAPRQPSASQVATSERTRIGAIMNSDEAKGREDLARHFAFSTAMTAAEAKTALGKAPKTAGGTTAAAGNRFDAAMAAGGNPVIGAGGGTEGGDPDDPTARIVGNYRASTGAKSRAA